MSEEKAQEARSVAASAAYQQVAVDEVRLADKRPAFGEGEADRDQAGTSLRIGLAVTLLELVVVLVAVGNLTDLLPLGRPGEPGSGKDEWTTSLVCLGVLGVSVQLVSALVALELWAVQPRRSGDAAALRFVAVWVVRGLVLTWIVAAVAAGVAGPYSWPAVVVLTVGAELVGLVALAVARWLVHSDDSGFGAGEPATRAAAESGVPSSEDAFTKLEAERQAKTLRAVGASGGGIRAAAFVLGGYQALQDRAVGLNVDDPKHEPHVFAVSGGSYTAAALAMRRTFQADGSLRETEADWRCAYTMASPELEWLRRHTRYLFEPARFARDGVVSLVMGAIVNIAIVAIMLRLVTWFSAQLAISTGFVQTSAAATRGGGLEPQVTHVSLAQGWGAWDWLAILAVPILCLAVVGCLTVWGWSGSVRLDDGLESPEAANATRRMSRSATLRPVFLGGAAVWTVLVLGIPAVTVGLVGLTTSNQPTKSAAAVLDGLGFGTEGVCIESFVDQVLEAADVAESDARVSPGEQRSRDAGSCGVSTTVSRTVDPDPTVGEPDEEEVAAAARDLFRSNRLLGQVTGTGALLALVVVLLRRGPSPEIAANARWYARLKRAVLTWVPLLLVIGLGVYAALAWAFRFMIRMDETFIVWATATTILAFAFAYLVDANATSMHRFYRSRLADAFAVGVDSDGTRADHLPDEVVYRFSSLSAAPAPPRLHIVTTLNSRKPNEAPTMRGGFPLVFGPERLELSREKRLRVSVPMWDYEEFAGPGRVSIMATVATSGAAISPLMGRYGAQMAPYRLLLTLFNFRVGTWVRNPMYVGAASPIPSGRTRWLWMTRRPGLAQIATEAVGSASSADARWVYLSDGGHLDNTGLVECVRHCAGVPGRIVVLDASNDPPGTWSAVGDAISVIRADLGIDLRQVELRKDDPSPFLGRVDSRAEVWTSWW